MSQKVVIVESPAGFTIAEVSNYTYLSEEVARAFARDKWGDNDPAVAKTETPVRGEI